MSKFNIVQASVKRNAAVCPSVRTSVCPIFFVTLIRRAVHTHCQGSTRHGQYTYPSEYYEESNIRCRYVRFNLRATVTHRRYPTKTSRVRNVVLRAPERRQPYAIASMPVSPSLRAVLISSMSWSKQNCGFGVEIDVSFRDDVRERQRSLGAVYQGLRTTRLSARRRRPNAGRFQLTRVNAGGDSVQRCPLCTV